jgi:hypothetical protein
MALPRRGGTMATPTARPTADDDFQEHARTYRGFVKGAVIFAGHVLAILLLMGWYFHDSFI